MNREQYTRLEQIPKHWSFSSEGFEPYQPFLSTDLIGRNPYDMYEELCRKTGQRHDPCVIDAFISAVRFMEGEPKRPWWIYTSERKHRLTGMDSFGPKQSAPADGHTTTAAEPGR